MPDKSNVISYNLREAQYLDEILGKDHIPTKDSTNEVCAVHTKVYEIPTTNSPTVLNRIRIWFNPNTGKATIKIRRVLLPIIIMAGTFTATYAISLGVFGGIA